MIIQQFGVIIHYLHLLKISKVGGNQKTSIFT